MTENILFKDILINDDTFTIPLQMNWFEGNNIKHQLQDLVRNRKFQSNLDHLFANTTDDQIDHDAYAANTMGEITGRSDDVIIGISNASASTTSTANSTVKLVDDVLPVAQADSKADAAVSAIATGIVNESKIKTHSGHDTILGVAHASATGSAIARSHAKLVSSNVPGSAMSNSVADVNLTAEAIGISNAGHISTGIGRDMIIGVAHASTAGSAITKSNARSLKNDDSLATANSESKVVGTTGAIGIENLDKITTGRGHDIVFGAASTSAMSEAEAKAFTHNIAPLANDHDPAAINVIEQALSNSTAIATATSQTTTLGLVNGENGKILTDRGNDIIVGLAYNKSSSNAETTSEAKSIANDIAVATANAESLAIAGSTTVGIANLGRINTGRNNDTVIGIAINLTTASADTDADAIAQADNPDTNTNSNAIADTANVFSIGITNDVSGLLITADGNDQVIGIGDIGISGGKIRADGGHDRIIGYGSTVGVQDSKIKLGNGNDFFKAAIVDIDPFTGEISHQADQSGSIKDATIIGDRGNDTFEIGGFESKVSIDGGRDHDVLKLWGNLDDYTITLGSSGDKSLTIEDADSILAVKNVEAFYFGDSDHAYHYNDFA